MDDFTPPSQIAGYFSKWSGFQVYPPLPHVNDYTAFSYVLKSEAQAEADRLRGLIEQRDEAREELQARLSECAQNRVADAQALQRAAGALERYADPTNWHANGICKLSHPTARGVAVDGDDSVPDNGELARQALASITSKEDGPRGS